MFWVRPCVLYSFRFKSRARMFLCPAESSSWSKVAEEEEDEEDGSDKVGGI